MIRTVVDPADNRPRFTLKNSEVPDGTIFIFVIEYLGSSAKAFTYVMLKAGGLWYVTGSGRVPVAAGWGAVERWLAADNRRVIEVRMVTDSAQLWPARVDGESAVSTTYDDPV